MFYIYKIQINNRVYIGYTGETIEKRLANHINLCRSGKVNKLYNYIRKYGEESINIVELYRTKSREDALNKECEFIQIYDSLNTGLNMTKGGDGGNTRLALSDGKYNDYLQKRSVATTGDKNPNYSGYTDEELLQFGIDIVKENGHFSYGLWLELATEKKLPKFFSKNRFGGSFKNFKVEIQKHFDFDILYKTSNKHKENLSKAIRKYSSDELIDFGVKLVKDNGYFIRDIWIDEYSELYGTPKSFSKNTFNGSFVEFRKQIASKMGVDLDTIIDPFHFKKRKNREKYRNSQKQN